MRFVHALLAALVIVFAPLLAVGQAQQARGELVMFEREGCVWCAQWDREIAPIYPKTDEARLFPLRRVDLDKDRPTTLQLAQPIHFTPTFVLAVCGREVGRITGYPGDDHFWGLLDVEIKRLQATKIAAC